MKIIELRKRMEQAINATSSENGSDTPDFILAEYLTDCLSAFDKAVSWREKWYGREPVSIDRSPTNITSANVSDYALEPLNPPLES